MNKFDKIYLSWRASKGMARIMVGELLIDGREVNFKYNKDNVNQAKRHGFNGYPGLSLDKLEHYSVLDLFSKRLINTERSDSDSLLDFWEIEPQYKNDKLYILAMTQGITSIDNFEFLANFELTDNLDFVTDIAGISYSNFNLSNLKRGDYLFFEKEAHKEDKNAVKILSNNQQLIGYVKKGHNLVFQHACSNELKIMVKHIINTGEEKQLFVRIFYSN